VCREFDLIHSAIRKIYKNRTKVIIAFEENESIIKRFRKPERSDVDEALLMWFKQERGDEVSLSVHFLTITFVVYKF
jgi:hypothetical protein